MHVKTGDSQTMSHRHPLHYYSSTLLLLTIFVTTHTAASAATPCRSYCGNLTVDYPFATAASCGHPSFQNLLFCVNDVLMIHLPSGSYRLLNIDYSFHSLTLHDPFLSTCSSLYLRHHPSTATPTTTTSTPNGLIIPPSLSPFLTPSSDTIFLLLHCSPLSPLFQGFPSKHIPCRNVSGMGCDDYLACPAWRNSDLSGGGGGGERCCGVAFESIKEVNLSKLECQGYSSAYNVAPVKVAEGAREWAYGIRMMYSVPAGDYAFCRSCEATGGACGYDAKGEDAGRAICICGTRNSTTNCDSGMWNWDSIFIRFLAHAVVQSQYVV